MTDYQLANIQVALAKANSAISYLDIVCNDCPKKRGHTDCDVSQARVRLAMASLALNGILERKKEVRNE